MTSISPELRKAAILISALDAATADHLLDQMGEQQAARVRHAVMQLDEVAPHEQDSILAEFFGRTAPSRDALDADGGVELQLSSSPEHSTRHDRSAGSWQAESSHTARHETQRFDAEPRDRFQFLREASSDQLARRLEQEHPQLIALVLAHLPAEKSAELVERLPSSLQDEVLDRLAELDDAEPEILADLEGELERMFAGALRPRTSDARRHVHLQAILGHLRRKSLEKTAENPAPLPTAVVQPETWEPDAPTAIPFDQLMTLTAADFFALFEQADPRVVMLALAGAPRRLFERYVSQFSTDRAIEFERHLEQLRPLRLRDVETAQQELAVLAGRRLQSARTAAESSRRFAAAA